MNLIFIIGPARSGTKIFRDTIAQLSGFSCVPYDVNMIWRYKNSSISDVLSAKSDLVKERRRLLSYFSGFKSENTQYLLEKSVSNTVRIEYILQLFPEAKFVFLLRDSFDVVESVERQWRATTTLKYKLAKASKIPLKYLIHHAFELIRRYSNQPKAIIWGVNVPGLEEFDRTIEKAIFQLEVCINAMKSDMKLIPENNLHITRYESFTKDPRNTLKDFSSWLGQKSDNVDSMNFSNIRNFRGKGKDKLLEDLHPKLRSRINTIEDTVQEIISYHKSVY